MTAPTTQRTHEAFLHAVRDLVAEHATDLDAETIDRLRHIKLVYGIGTGRERGRTAYNAWTNGHGPTELVEVTALAEEGWTQLAGTTIHELAHVIAGHKAGHGIEWKDTAVRLGFVKRPAAAGQHYCLAMIRPRLRHAITDLAARMSDGSPMFALALAGGASHGRGARPCSAGTGARGGTSRGAGSGSRQRLYECACTPPQKIRAATDDLDATCNKCGSAFTRPDAS